MRASPRRVRWPGQRAASCRALFLLAVAISLPIPAFAERSVSVAGTRDSLSVIAESASLHDVLEVIAHHQRLVVFSHASLDDSVSVEIVDATLPAVVRRLLRDYNFTLQLRGVDGIGRLWIHPGGTHSAAVVETKTFGVADPDDIDTALRILERGSAAERLEATAVLAAFGGDEVFVALTGALFDPDPAVREEAVAGLADLRPAESVHLLGEALFDESTHVRAAAIDALADLDSDAAATRLGWLLGSAELKTRAHAVDALGEMRAPRAGALLVQATRDADESVRALAAEYLAERQR